MESALAHLGPLNLWHPEVLVLIVLLSVLYHYVAYIPRDRPPTQPVTQPVTRFQKAAFVSALAVLYLIVGSPLAAIGEVYSFIGYSLQMALMTMVLPRLLIYSAPVDLLDRWTELPVFGRVWRALTSPAVAVVTYNGIATLLLLPVSVNIMLSDNDAHALGQMLLMFFSLCLWWPLSRRTANTTNLRPAGELMYIFISYSLMMPIVIALLITSASAFRLPAWYRVYAHTSAPHTTPIEGQITGAVILVVFMLGSYGLRALQAWGKMRELPTPK